MQDVELVRQQLDAAAEKPADVRLPEPCLRLERAAAEVEDFAGVDLAGLSGSGIAGRVTKKDLVAHLERGGSRPTAPASPGMPAGLPSAVAVPMAAHAEPTFNAWPGAPYECSDWEQIEKFAEVVNKAGYASPVRTPRGRDIMAACGQLKSASVKERASARMAALRSEELSRMPS